MRRLGLFAIMLSLGCAPEPAASEPAQAAAARKPTRLPYKPGHYVSGKAACSAKGDWMDYSELTADGLYAFDGGPNFGRITAVAPGKFDVELIYEDEEGGRTREVERFETISADSFRTIPRLAGVGERIVQEYRWCPPGQVPPQAKGG